MKKQFHPFIANKETLESGFTFDVPLLQYLHREFHPINRPPDMNRVEAIREDIRNGNWEAASGTYIKFDNTGCLIDGNHRFLAHMAENVPLISSVIYGLPRSAINYQDTNRPRSVAANTVILEHRIAGTIPSETDFSNKTLQMRVAKWYIAGLKWMNGMPNARRRLSDSEMIEALAKNNRQINFAIEAATSKHTKRPGFLAAVAIYYTKAPKKALDFREQVSRGIKADAVCIALRDYLKLPSDGGSQPQYDYFNTVHAINCFHNEMELEGEFGKNVRASWMV